MYNEQIEALISAALADGVLTEKEKQILFKKAESMGIDLDEFEMVLDARLVELKKKEAQKAEQHQLEMEKAKAAQKSAPKSDKYGEIRKCPACGALIKAFQAKCPECGYEFASIEANLSSKKLADKLNGSFLGMQKKTIIESFPIPNTKADLLEFLTSMKPHINDGSSLSSAYWKKYQECINKAQISFPNDKDFQGSYDTFEQDKKTHKIKSFFKSKTFIACVVLLCLGGCSWYSSHSFNTTLEGIKAQEDANIQEIKDLSQTVNANLKEGDIDAASDALENCTVDLSGTASDLYRSLLSKVVLAYKSNGDSDKAKSLFLAGLQKLPSYDKDKMEELASEIGVDLNFDESSSTEYFDKSSSKESDVTEDETSADETSPDVDSEDESSTEN